ncbi:MAG TPA: hypothetical protein VNZ52_02375 [Candidatus Thermoplasmatota archaeon]|nr:hypothetical protein [Candidatus Thermoplasmatota archaeon]
MPRELLEKITAQSARQSRAERTTRRSSEIRQRKGLKPEPYPAEYYAG